MRPVFGAISGPTRHKHVKSVGFPCVPYIQGDDGCWGHSIGIIRIVLERIALVKIIVMIISAVIILKRVVARTQATVAAVVAMVAAVVMVAVVAAEEIIILIVILIMTVIKIRE